MPASFSDETDPIYYRSSNSLASGWLATLPSIRYHSTALIAMFPDSSPTPSVVPPSITHSRLIQTLLNLACPGAAQYQAHRLRSDGVYRVVVRTATGFPIISIPAPALLLTELGVLVESDRHAIAQQLG